MSQGVVFPAFLRLEYRDDGNAKSAFARAVDEFASAGERRMARFSDEARDQLDKAFSASGSRAFTAATAEIDRAMRDLKSSFSGGVFGLNFDTTGMRQAAAEAGATVEKLRAMRDAAISLADRTGDTSESTRKYVQALRAQVIDAERAKQSADAMATTYSRLQGEIDRTVGSSDRLAQSYRDTFTEAARAANAAANIQSTITANAERGSDPFNAATRNGAGFAALAEREALDELRRLEVGAAEGARLLAGALGNTDLALGRVTKSARDSAQAFIDAANAEQSMARELGLVKAQIDPLYLAQQRLDTEMERAERLFEAGKLDAREYGLAVGAAKTNFEQAAAAASGNSNALRKVADAQRQLRLASLGATQQLQDIAISLVSGQRAGIVFAQQLPQLAFALTGLEGSTNRTADRIGKLATFMSGPWGLAIGLGVAALAPLIGKLFEAEEAAKQVEFASYGLSEAQGVLGNVLDITTGRINTQNQALLALARAQVLVGQVQSKARAAEARKAIVDSSLPQFEVGGGPGGGIYIGRRRQIEGQVASNFLNDQINTEQAVRKLEQLREAGKITDETFAKLAASYANYGVELANQKVFEDAEKLLDGTGGRNLLKPKTERKSRTKADTSARDAERLANFGERADEAIARISERFDDQPRLVDQVAQSTRALDDILADVEKRRPPNFEKTLASVRAAKALVEGVLGAEIDRYAAGNQRNLDLLTLQAAGLDEQADILGEINRLDERLGLRRAADKLGQQRDDVLALLDAETLTAEARREGEAALQRINDELATNADLQQQATDAAAENVTSRQALNREIERSGALLQAELSVLDAARAGFTELLSGRETNVIGDVKQALKDLRGARLFDSLFGDVFDSLETSLRKQTPLGKSTARLIEGVDVATTATGRLASATDQAAATILQAARRIASNDNLGAVGTDGTITVAGAKAESVEITRRSVQEIADSVGIAMVKPFADILTRSGLGGVSRTLSPIVSGAIGGYLIADETGAILGGLKGIKGLPDAVDNLTGITGTLDKALGGAGTGTAVSSITDALGIRGSKTGAQIGGALGSFLPIPGGEIIGAIAGNIIGGLFKTTKKGFATIGSLDGSLGITGTGGNKSSYIEAASISAGSIIDSIERIADQLGGLVDATRGSVSIGIRHGDYRVDASGRGVTKKARGAVDFDDDASAAIAYATADLIRDGVITGLRSGTQRLLQGADDLEAGLEKALSFENVFAQLREIKDPVGAALDGLDREFARLKRLFDEAAATTEEYASLEELYGLKRAEAIKQANQRTLGSLLDLQRELAIGENGLSLRSRYASAEALFSPLEARVQAGDVSAFDDYAEAAGSLLSLSRQMYGSQTEYFSLLEQISDLTDTTIAAQQTIAEASANRDSPFTETAVASNDNASVVGAIDRQTTAIVDAINSQMSAANSNLGTLIQQAAAGGGSSNLAGINLTNQF